MYIDNYYQWHNLSHSDFRSGAKNVNNDPHDVERDPYLWIYKYFKKHSDMDSPLRDLSFGIRRHRSILFPLNIRLSHWCVKKPGNHLWDWNSTIKGWFFGPESLSEESDNGSPPLRDSSGVVDLVRSTSYEKPILVWRNLRLYRVSVRDWVFL